jgi:hypothetical protein
LESAVNLTLADFDLPPDMPALALEAPLREGGRGVVVSETADLTVLPVHVEGGGGVVGYRYFVLAPQLRNGWYAQERGGGVVHARRVFAGEVDKFVTFADARFERFVVTQDGFVVFVNGSDGEAVHVGFVRPGGGGGLELFDCVVGNGQMRLQCGADGCECVLRPSGAEAVLGALC